MRFWRNFNRLAGALALVLALPGAGNATCQGTDLRESLNATERAELSASVKDVPFSSGNHWRATRGDKVIHLIGTIHISDDRLAPVVSRLKAVIETSELLLLEMSQTEEDALKSDMLSRPELLFLQDHTLPELLSEADWQDLSNAMQARGIPAILASRFQPWYLSVMLAMPPCLVEKFQGKKMRGLDHQLREIAQTVNVQTQGLEPHDTLFQLFGDDPIQEQIDVMLLGLESQDQSLDMLETVISAYFEQNHAVAWEMTRRVAMQNKNKPKATLERLFSEMEHDMLTARNHAWIPVITQALEKSTRITVAAGAGHWSGEEGVLALLENEFFTLERLPF